MPTLPTSTLLSARAAGSIYLQIIGLGLFGEVFVRGALVVGGDPAATAVNVLRSEHIWRIGIVTDLVMHVLDVPLIVFFYLLLRPVNPALALLATVFNIVQTCVLASNKLSLVGVLSLLATPMGPNAGELGKSLALVAVDLHGHGFGIGLVFFGCACLVRGHLIVKSGYMPRALGVLLQLAGVSYLINSIALLLSPPLAAALFPAVLLPALVGELALSSWLLLTDQRSLNLALARAASPRTPVT